MNFITAENLSKRYGEKLLFENISFFINEGQKIAFVAKNGTGKTSLLKILSGIDTPDGDGKVSIKKGLKVSFLSQNPDIDSSKSIYDCVFHSGNEMIQAIGAYNKSLQNEADGDGFQKALDNMNRLNAWDYEVMVNQVLSELGVNDLEQKVSSLSGGQKKRVALAQLLLEEPDLFVLDEPTNHLDLDMIEWLEGFLKKKKCTLFLVTHDRYFLDNVCNEILELDQGELYRYKGDFAYYLIKKAERIENDQSNISKAKSVLRKELAWMRKQPKARGTKSKSRIDSYFEIKEKAGKKIDDESVELEINMQRLGSKILEFHKVSKSLGGKLLLDKFEYKFKRRERIGIVGPNGSGKSTFLNMLTNKMEPNSGKIVIGDTIVYGYYQQTGLKFKEGQKVIDAVRDIAEYIPLTKGRKLTALQLLERFLFPKHMHFAHISTLSGGEKRRLYLLTILMKNPNFIILDEPTNDLDIVTIQVLENFLLEYPGCLVIVSHDRHFMDKLVDHLFVFDGKGNVKDFNGNYTDYSEQKKNLFKKMDKSPKPEVKKEVQAPVPKKTVSSLTYEERKLLKRLEKELEKLSTQKEDILEQFNSGITDFDKIAELSKELKSIEEKIEEKEMDWMELAEKE